MNKQLIISLFSFSILCSSCESYEFTNLQLNRQGWDTLYIETSFSSKSFFSSKTALPINEQITLSTPSKGIFYKGISHTIALPDLDLPSEAEITLKVEAEFQKGKVLTEQRSFKASPKLYSIRNNIVYPYDDATNQVLYNFSYNRKRPVTEGSSDFKISKSGLSYPTTFELSVKNDPSVSIKFSPQDQAGAFDLSKSSQFKAFESGLQRSVTQYSHIELQVKAFSIIDKQEISFSLDSIVFDQKSKDEQISFCQIISNSVAVNMQEKYSKMTGKDARAIIDTESCTYDPITRKYTFRINNYWESKKHIFSDYYTFESSGYVTAHDNGSWKYDQTGVNQALQDSEDFDSNVGMVLMGAAVIHGLSQSSSNQ